MRLDRRIGALAMATVLCAAAPAFAHHVVYLEFSAFNLDAYASVNRYSPPTEAGLAVVRELIVANMVEDYAPFDIYFTTVQPAHGNYTQVRFFSTAASGDDSTIFGCAGGDCCQFGFCGGSSCEVYAGSFAGFDAWQGDNDSAQRIANAISHTASHELGHLLGPSHCHAADDWSATGGVGDCVGGRYEASADENVNWHIMASAATTDLALEDYAGRDRFFSIHSSRRVLYKELQARNHWAPLPNLDGGATGTDLGYGRLRAPTRIKWHGRLSDDTAFGPHSTWSTDAGNRGDIFLTGDVTGDGRSDLVYGRIRASDSVRWYVRASEGNAFGAYATWSLDAGDAGDVFRLADVDGDGRDDLVYGRDSGGQDTTWYVRLSTGTAFGDYTTWAEGLGGDLGRNYLYLVGDVTADGLADLVIVRRLFGDWRTFVHESTGSSFEESSFTDDLREGDEVDFDSIMLADADGRGGMDLVASHVRGDSNTVVYWHRWLTYGCVPYDPELRLLGSCFQDDRQWTLNAGNAGDLFRVGDGNGDGLADLFYARPRGMTSLTNPPDLSQIRWYGRLANGEPVLGDSTTWAPDAGDEGDIFP